MYNIISFSLLLLMQTIEFIDDTKVCEQKKERPLLRLAFSIVSIVENMEIDVLTSSFLGLRDKLHHIALNYLESDEDAKDALQDTWLKLRNRGEVETTSEARNKLVTVLRHVCIDRLRKAKPIPIDEVSVRDMNAHNMVEDNGGYQLSDLKKLETLLQEGLTSQQREIFILIIHEGMEYEQVAKKLSMSVEAVRMNMSRIRKKMRETYKKLNR